MEDVEKKEPYALMVGMYIGTATMENTMEAFQKNKNRIIIWPSNPTSAYAVKGNENKISKSSLHSHVYCNIDNSWDMETI